MSADVLRELAYVKAVFQLRAISAVIHGAPCGEHPQGENSRSEVEGEACRRGDAAGGRRPT